MGSSAIIKAAGVSALLALGALALLASTGPASRPTTELAETNHGEKNIDADHIKIDDSDEKKFSTAITAAESALGVGQYTQAKASLAQAKDALDSVDSDNFPHDGDLIKKEMGKALKDLEERINEGVKYDPQGLKEHEEKPTHRLHQEHEDDSSASDAGHGDGWAGPAVHGGIKSHRHQSTRNAQLKHASHRQMQLRQRQQLDETPPPGGHPHPPPGSPPHKEIKAPAGGWGTRGSAGPGPALIPKKAKKSAKKPAAGH